MTSGLAAGMSKEHILPMPYSTAIVIAGTLNVRQSGNISAARVGRLVRGNSVQVMGFNYSVLGYDSVREMFDHFSADER